MSDIQQLDAISRLVEDWNKQGVDKMRITINNFDSNRFSEIEEQYQPLGWSLQSITYLGAEIGLSEMTFIKERETKSHD